MNKYLLLRDNKQSGPYSVAELIEKGIKPYDLVWLEGKSAAWRYPGEMEELKPHSPNTEDQPFDRFYKKPESIEHGRFEPRPTSAIKNESQPSKKIYINFPSTTTKVHQTISVTPSEIIKEERQSPEPIIKYITQPPAKTQNRNILFIAAGATGLLILSLISYFVVNNNNQEKNINQLNALVQQLEQNVKAENTDVIISAINEIEQAATIEEPIMQKPSVEKKVVSIQENKIKTPQPSTEEKPVQNQLTEIPTSAAPAAVHENLYKLVSVKSNNYKTGVLGGISNLRLELTNNSNIELHKVAIEVKYLGPEKKVVRTQIVYFQNVAAGAHSTIDVPKSNRGVTVDYIITDIKS